MLELKHVSKKYDHNIFNDLNLKFHKQGLHVIVGKSGCGKSTLLYMLGGLDKDYDGVIECDGQDIKKIPNYIKKKVGFIFQQYYLLENENVKENVSLIEYFKKIFVDRKQEYLERLKIEKLLKYKSGILSGGQKQRVAIYRGFIADQPIILCDEPTGALDKINSEEVFKILKELARDRLVILITHDLLLANRYHDYLYEITNQQIVLTHQNEIKAIALKEKKRGKPFFLFLFNYLKKEVKNSFLIIQLLFLACLSIMLVFSLTKSTNIQIKKQLEQIIPSTTIMFKNKNHNSLTINDLKEIDNKYINYHFLQNDDIEILGLSLNDNYQANKTLYISDYIQASNKELVNDRELILSKSTYDELLYLTNKKSLLNENINLYFNYRNEIKSYKVKIKGVDNKNTVMETMYLKEYALNMMIKELYGIEEGNIGFLQVTDKKAINYLKKKYHQYDFQIANSSLNNNIDKTFEYIEWVLLAFCSLAVVAACFLLGIILYLLTVKKRKYFAILQSMGCSFKQIVLLLFLHALSLSMLAYLQAYIVIKQLFILLNRMIKESISYLIDDFLIVSNDSLLFILIFVLLITIVCSIMPILKVKKIDVIEELRR